MDEQAVTWLVRMTSGDATVQERAAFSRWRVANPQHEEALISARRLWVGLGPAIPVPERKPRPLRHAGVALAASIALFTLGQQYLHVWQYDYVTAPGERQSIALADGSRVALSSDSAVNVHFVDGARRVELARGEAYFEVVHDARHPFTVTAGRGQIRDIGTAFSVRVERGGDIRVIVAEGSVEVRAAGSHATLVQDQSVSFGSETIGVITHGDTTKDLSWLRGRLIVENQPLDAVLRELNRHSADRVLLLGDRVGDHRVNAVIDLGHTDAWLEALRDSQKLHLARLPGYVILY